MKKVLLSLVAVLASLGAYAQGKYAVGDYIFTSTGKFKVTEILAVDQPNTWAGYSAETFSPYTPEDDDDLAGITSVNSEEGAQLTKAIDVKAGESYVVSFSFKGDADGSSSITAGALNQIDAWVSQTEDGATKPANLVQVASTFTIIGYEWTDVAWAFTNTLNIDGEALDGKLNLLFSRINVGASIATNLQVVKVAEVYDTRIAERRLDYINQLLADPNFNITEAAAAADKLQDDVEAIQDMLKTNDPSFDDEGTATEMMSGLDESLEAYLNVTSISLNARLSGTNIAEIPEYGRGRFSSYGNVELEGGNWGHLKDLDNLMSAIQNSFANTATYRIKHADFPKGKYFFTAEIRNANTGKDSWPCTPVFNLETTCTMFVGKDTIEVGPIVGEAYQKFYAIGEIEEDGGFFAGVYWPGTSGGGAFYIKNVEVRSFGDIEAMVARKQAWDTFIAQWNAAVNARNEVIRLQSDANYPYAKDSLANALTQWDPLYNKVLVEDNWIDADGKDTGKATNEELTEWATYQGYYPAEDAEDYGTKYALVRGYQYAASYVKAQAQAFTDFAALIAKAEATRDDAMNVNGDKELLDAEIKYAKELYAKTLANATDATKEADDTALADATATLEEAIEAFLKSATLTPIVDIDFSNGFTPVYDEEDDTAIMSYVIKGEAGEMAFPLASVNLETTAPSSALYQLGYNELLGDVLRVGKGDATVTLAEGDIPTDEDVIRVQFDLWVGNLTKRWVSINLQNAAGERVGGFELNRYEGQLNYNTFNNDGNTGLDILKYVTAIGSSSAANAEICVDANKSSFDLIIDYKAQTMQGSVENGKNGTCNGDIVPIPELEDNKVAKFVISSTYDNVDRRCWFDNLVIYKYASAADGPVDTAIDAVKGGATSAELEGIYTLEGIKVNSYVKGLNIEKYADGTSRIVLKK